MRDLCHFEFASLKGIFQQLLLTSHGPKPATRLTLFSRKSGKCVYFTLVSLLTLKNIQDKKIGNLQCCVCPTDKKANMTHQKGNPQMTANTSLGLSDRGTNLRRLLTDQPHCILSSYLEPGGIPPHSFCFSWMALPG